MDLRFRRQPGIAPIQLTQPARGSRPAPAVLGGFLNGSGGLIGVYLVAAAISGCAQDQPDLSYPDQIRLAFETAKAGDMITIEEGVHEFDRTLTLNADGVTVKGNGMDKTILSFKNQVAGAEGVIVNGGDFVIEDLAIEDPKGDGLKINEAENVTIRRVRTEWTNGPNAANGAYGIYPVQTTNVVVEESVSVGASDAGIYVGQSRNAIIRNNHVYNNVAGIEIENTAYADVHGNRAENNTAGIEVFNMPHLPVTGHSVRVYDNDIVGNNTPNFAEKGTTGAGLPSGVGVIINSIDKIEVFGNRLERNETANTMIISYFVTPYYGTKETQDIFDPYPEEIYFYQNQYSGGGNAPSLPDLDQLRQAMFAEAGRLPDIVWDGAFNPEKSREEAKICIGDEQAGIVSVDAVNGFKNVVADKSAHQCTLPKLAPVQLSN